ncbi:MAG: ABC transporter substrate-binding protein [bacterium]|nr:ABC transporter substrate-binding protein [bacterium]
MKTLQFYLLFLVKVTRRYAGHFFSGYLKYLVAFLVVFSSTTVLAKSGVFRSPQTSFSEGIIGVYEVNTLPAMVTHLISEPLVSLDKSGKPQPKLASGWQVNNNATVYTFKLRSNLYWSDGQKLRPSDIQFNLPDVEVTYPDDQTLTFKLADSFIPFPTLLNAPIFRKNSLVGVGPYKVVNQEMNRSLVSKLVLAPQKGNGLPVVTVRFYPDEKIARTAFELGEVESLLGLSSFEGLQDYPQVALKEITNLNRLTAVFYNTKDAVLSDKNMRKALSFASPEPEAEEKAITSISTSSWAFNNTLREAGGDLTTAKSYLAKVQSGKDKNLVLTTIPSLAGEGGKVVEGWKKLGLSVQLKVESGIPQNFQALLISQPIPSDPDQYALWHSTQEETNISKYSSPRVDKDLEDGRKTADAEKRKEKYLDFQKVLLDDSPATFLYFPPIQVLYRQRIKAALEMVLPFQVPQGL